MAVVDPYGRVHGLEGLRIADASIMSDCVRANINATTMFIGERIADSHLREQRSAIMADESLHWKTITEVAGLIESMQNTISGRGRLGRPRRTSAGS